MFKNQLVDGLHLVDLAAVLWYGLRLSLKTSGIVLLVSFLLATVIGTISSYWFNNISYRIRQWVAYISTFIFTLLFCIRIPYYSIFNSSFNLMLVNGANDDLSAILDTAIESYGLLWRFPIAILLGVGLAYIAWLFIRKQYKWLNSLIIFNERELKRFFYVKILACFILVVGGAVFLRYGGAFSYSGSINWESASRLHSNLLNEAILDDGQALYRVYSSQNRLKKARTLTATPAELKEMIQLVDGNISETTIDESFKRTIKNSYLKEQPKSVIFILGESYGLWPFLDTFKGPGNYLVQEAESLARSPRGILLEGLAFGAGTMGAVNGYVTGLPDTGLYPNYEKTSYNQIYAMGIGNMMKQLGYKTVFWYGGFGAWQDIRKFTLAQGFDEFHESSSFKNQQGNAWGVPDKVLFQEVESYMQQYKGEKVFHFILTTSNHPPYDIDVKHEGFNLSKVTNHQISELPQDDKRINELGHIWYADHVMGEFVKRTEEHNPDTLFIITGDHSERFTFNKEVDFRTASAIPIILYGKGIDHNWLLPQPYTSALQLIPTIATLVGKSGDVYYSLLPSMFEPTSFVFNYNLWLDKEGYHKLSDGLSNRQKKYVEAIKTIAMWRIIKGNSIE
ncbi:phosphoglycerol transferase I [Veillonella criceti]|uniref:Phosphoglycerol transferase I n=2 Tax=Veillonella criceti TaxID=103891 RepID=A0A380NF07_9FIRM|nr:phosphoglycerol transferase I [Veillonella criceti]